MKKPISKAALGFLAALASVGSAHADGKVKIPAGAANQAIIEQLVKSGHIIPLAEANWYQVDQGRLNEALQQSDAGEKSADETIRKLKAIVGEGVDIRRVDIFNARLGTQDITG